MSSADKREALITRETKETTVQLALSLDGGPLNHLAEHQAFANSHPAQDEAHHASQESDVQQIWVWTGIGFLDHMLHALAKHAGWSLRLRTAGDLASRSPISRLRCFCMHFSY